MAITRWWVAAAVVAVVACQDLTRPPMRGPAASGVPVAATGFPLVYVANNGVDAIQILSTRTNTLETSVPALSPRQVDVTPDGALIYATNGGSSTIQVISTADQSIVATIPVSTNPVGVTVSPLGDVAYVTLGPGTGFLNVISTATNTNIGIAPAGIGPNRVAFTPDGAFAYTTDFGQTFVPGTVSVIETGTRQRVAQIPTDSGPWDIEITPDGTFAYVSHLTPGPTDMTVIATSTNTVVARIPGAGGGLAASPDGTLLFSFGRFQGLSGVVAIDVGTHSISRGIPLTGGTDLAISDDGAYLYVSQPQLGQVSVIEVARDLVVATIPVGTGPCCTGPQGLVVTPGAVTPPPRQPPRPVQLWELTVQDPEGDNTGPIDVVDFRLTWDPITGNYEIQLLADAAAPFAGDFRVNVNLWNLDTQSLFQDVVNDFLPARPLGSLKLVGVSSVLQGWTPGTSVLTNRLPGAPSPPGVGLFRTSVASQPFTFLTNEDYVALADPNQPVLVVEVSSGGCDALFWRRHPAAWPGAGLAPTANFNATFQTTLLDPSATLGEAIRDLVPGVFGDLARMGTAALLNARHTDVDYTFTDADVITAVQTGDVAAVQPFARAHEALNCPLGWPAN